MKHNAKHECLLWNTRCLGVVECRVVINKLLIKIVCLFELAQFSQSAVAAICLNAFDSDMHVGLRQIEYEYEANGFMNHDMERTEQRLYSRLQYDARRYMYVYSKIRIDSNNQLSIPIDK